MTWMEPCGTPVSYTHLNIPVRMELGREIRKVFVPREGSVFVDADYSQIELRILAHMSGDDRLIGAYRSAQDIHAITASEVFHIPLDQVTPLQLSLIHI